jgi:hypothetical protein
MVGTALSDSTNIMDTNPKNIRIFAPVLVKQNDTVSIEVVSGYDNIPGIYVYYDNSIIGVTGAGVHISFNATTADIHSIAASKDGYFSGVAEVRVLANATTGYSSCHWAPMECKNDFTVTMTSPESVNQGDFVIVKLYRTYEGIPYPKTTVYLDDTNIGVTDDDGEVYFKAENSGIYTLNAKYNYGNVSRIINIIPKNTSIPTLSPTPTQITTPTPSEVDKNDATIVQPCEDNSNKMCELIVKNGVIVYKGPVYPETIDVNNPSEPIFPIKDPNYKNHVGISHPCTPTGNTPTYSQICDASYINGRLTNIMKYTHKEYPCSSDVSGICRENSQESIPVRTPIVLTNTPIPTTNNPTQVNYYPVTSPEQTVTNTPEPTSQQVTTGGYAKIISQDTVVEQDKSIIEKIKELFTNIWKEYVG